jgi:hypothetical protein
LSLKPIHQSTNQRGNVETSQQVARWGKPTTPASMWWRWLMARPNCWGKEFEDGSMHTINLRKYKH